ncbi:MAG: UDP-2,3-diacylglucosamine diphosphatase [Bacteroidales bacterium]
MTHNKKTYFVSDVHLGAPDFESSLKREKLLVQWLEEKSKDAEAFYLLGDIFDFWFEYKRVVPRGFTRFLGTLSKLTDQGIPIYFFTGNHDIWVFDYLPRETGVSVIKGVHITSIKGKQFYIAHGDGLGPYDKKYNALKKIFTNKFLQWAFKRIHPNFSVGFAHRWSKYSRGKHEYPETPDYEKEWLVQHARDVLKNDDFDYFVFGHRHIPIKHELSGKSTFINLGDWLQNFSYGEFDGETFRLKFYQDKD